MKLPSERRCPWCGESVDDIKNDQERYHTRECKFCGNKYAVHYKNSIFLFSDIILIFLLISLACTMISKFIPIIFCAVLIIVSIIFQGICPYEMYDEMVPVLKRHKARLVFDKEGMSSADYLKIRLFLMEKSIVPICFIDENDAPISNTIFISIESARKVSNTKYECAFAFLPLSAAKYNAAETGNFYIFDGENKRVGRGQLMSEYSKFV